MSKGFDNFLKKLDDSATEAVNDPDFVQGEIADVLREAYDLMEGQGSGGMTSPMGIPRGMAFHFGDMGVEPMDMGFSDPFDGLDIDALRRQVLDALSSLDADDLDESMSDTGWQHGGGPGNSWKKRRIIIRRRTDLNDGK